MSKINELWERYELDPSLKDELIVACLPLVKNVARSIASSLPDHVDVEDLASEGVFGLMDAIEKYNSVGNKFETYAVLRIRGSIMDHLRSADWVPRTFRKKMKDLTSAHDVLFKELGREPLDGELAEFLEWDVEELFRVRGEYSSSMVEPLDGLRVDQDDQPTNRAKRLPDTGSVQNLGTDYEGVAGRLASGISTLSEQQKLVLSLYYIENMSLKEIGAVLSVTESRASQIHSRGLDALRQVCADPLLSSD